jgi:hypothetical protein
MFPFVPSGSTLELVSLCDGHAEARVGDIVAYVGRTGMIAHRVIAVERSAAPPLYELRGDAQDFSEVIDRDALAYRVTRVSYAGVSYATSGWVGRALAHLGVRRAWSFRWLRAAALQVAAAAR